MWQGYVYRVWQAISVDVGSGSAFVSGCCGVAMSKFLVCWQLAHFCTGKG